MLLFFEFIQIALGVRSCFSKVPTNRDWQTLFKESKRQALVGVLFDGIQHLPAEQMPPREILLQWYVLTEKIKKLNVKLNQRALSLSTYFQEQRWEYVILKGQGVATLYPKPLLRTPGDIDVWARPQSHKNISLNQLRELLIDKARILGKADNITYTHVHLPLFEDTEVELHFTPSWISSFRGNRILQKYFVTTSSEQFSHYVELPEGSGNIPVPTSEFNRVFIVLHIYRHLFGEGIGLRQMMDYYYVLRQPITEESKQRTLKLLAELGLLKFVAATMYVLQTVFGLEKQYLLIPSNEKEGRFLLNEILLAGNFGKYDKRNQHSSSEGDISRFVHSVKRNFRFFQRYPNEVISDPFFRARYYIYRHWKGWK